MSNSVENPLLGSLAGMVSLQEEPPEGVLATTTAKETRLQFCLAFDKKTLLGLKHQAVNYFLQDYNVEFTPYI